MKTAVAVGLWGLVWLSLAASVRSGQDESPAPPVSSKDDAETIATLQAALEQWLNEVEFVASYSRHKGRAASVEAALARDWGHEFADARVTGVYNKAFGKVRCSGDPAAEPQVLSQTGDSREVANLDFDEVASADVRLDYKPTVIPGDPRGLANFLPKRSTTGADRLALGKFDAGWSSIRRLSPLSIDGNEIGTLLTAPLAATDVAQRVVRGDGEQLSIVTEFTEKGYRTERTVVFRLSGSHPVVERVDTLMTGASGDRWETHSLAQDFVECPGGPAARTIRSAYTNRDPRHPELPWAVNEWVSPDLGARTPTAEDFLVAIHDQTRVRGVRNPESAMTGGKLDLDKVKPADLTARLVDSDLLAASADADALNRRDPLRALWVSATGGVLLALAAMAVWRQRRRR